MPIYGHMYNANNSFIFLGQSRIFLYGGAQEIIIYQNVIFWWVEYIIKFISRRRPLTSAAVARSAKSVETPKLHQKIPL